MYCIISGCLPCASYVLSSFSPPSPASSPLSFFSCANTFADLVASVSLAALAATIAAALVYGRKGGRCWEGFWLAGRLAAAVSMPSEATTGGIEALEAEEEEAARR